MEASLEYQIRERAYHLWLAGGCPEGQADRHWFDAEREVLAMHQALGAIADHEPAKPAKRRAPKRRKSAAKIEVATAQQQAALS